MREIKQQEAGGVKRQRLDDPDRMGKKEKKFERHRKGDCAASIYREIREMNYAGYARHNA